MYVIGLILDKCFVNSTDIEYALHYMKELSLKIQNIIDPLLVKISLNKKNLEKKA